jgi:hypothetical protein
VELNLPSQIDEFFDQVRRGSVEIYNEFSLQHELGIYLRNSLPSEWKVQFERPVDHFGIHRGNTSKKEIDISVLSGQERHAIELKFPRNGQYPETMFSCCTDIEFLEQLTRHGFTGGLFVIAAEDRLFHSGPSGNELYASFRAKRPIHGTIQKPTGARDRQVNIRGTYVLDWRSAECVHYAQLTVTCDQAKSTQGL